MGKSKRVGGGWRVSCSRVLSDESRYYIQRFAHGYMDWEHWQSFCGEADFTSKHTHARLHHMYPDMFKVHGILPPSGSLQIGGLFMCQHTLHPSSYGDGCLWQRYTGHLAMLPEENWASIRLTKLNAKMILHPEHNNTSTRPLPPIDQNGSTNKQTVPTAFRNKPPHAI